jgi:hypothetical protein
MVPAKKNRSDFRHQVNIKGPIHRQQRRLILATSILQTALEIASGAAISTNVHRNRTRACEQPTPTTEMSRTDLETMTECRRETIEWQTEMILIEIAATILSETLFPVVHDFNVTSIHQTDPA